SEMTVEPSAARSSGAALRRIVVASAAIAAVAAAFPARAADDEFTRKGPYFGIGVSRAMNTFADTFQDATPVPHVSVSDTSRLNARGGCRFAPLFSTELEYEFLDTFGVRALGVHAAELSTHAITVNAKFSVPAGRFQPYLLLGLGVIVPDIQSKSFIDFDADSSPAGRLGLGVDFYATPNVVLNLGFESIVNGAKVETHTLGVEDHAHGLDYVALQ